MSLIGSLTSGVSAMRTFTKGLEVIGNNIANVNTTGYKSSKTTFEDSFSNTLRGSAPSSATASNISAVQVGTGVKLAAISPNFTQGGLATTGVNTDLGISGNGFFRVLNTTDNSEYVTRAGDFRIDDKGYLVTNKGFRVQGLTSRSPGTTPNTVGSIRLRTPSEIAAAWPKQNAENIANTASAATIADGVETALFNLREKIATKIASISSSNGTEKNLASLAEAEAALADATTAEATLATAYASYPSPTAAQKTELATATAAKDAIAAAINAGKASFANTANPSGEEFLGAVSAAHSNANKASSVADASALAATVPPTLSSFSFDRQGNLVEFYSDGSSATTNRLLLQTFNDPSGLQRVGDNLFNGMANAGPVGGLALTATNNAPGGNGLGTIESGTLELSNVDLTEQFANMITTQRSFQASSRVVTVSDQVLEEVVNLKR